MRRALTESKACATFLPPSLGTFLSRYMCVGEYQVKTWRLPIIYTALKIEAGYVW